MLAKTYPVQCVPLDMNSLWLVSVDKADAVSWLASCVCG